MKKLFSFILVCTLMFCLAPASLAASGQDKITPAAETKSILVSEKGDDISLDISFSHSLNTAETLRKRILDIAIEQRGSLEEVLSSPESYLTYETKLFCEISIDEKASPDNEEERTENDGAGSEDTKTPGEEQTETDNEADSEEAVWYTLKELTDESFSISLFNEILPLLREKGEDFTALHNGFTLYIRILTASENFLEEGTKTVYIHTPSEPEAVEIPSFCYVHYDIPSDVTLPEALPSYSLSPVKEDILLPNLLRNGYIFNGWRIDGAPGVRIIEKGTRALTLTTEWTPEEYDIYYITTININAGFGKVDITDMPETYTVGTKIKIKDIDAPVGYVFCGWYNNKDFTGERVSEIPVGTYGDVALYAKWKTVQQAVNDYIAEKKFGDTDSDGKISSSDARYVLRAVVGLEKPDYEILRRIDYFNTVRDYGELRISAENARVTLRIAVGLDSLYEILTNNGLLPKEEWMK